MVINGATNLLTNHVRVVIEWDEWDGSPSDHDLKVYAAGAASLRSACATIGAAVQYYTKDGATIPSEHDTTDANGAVVVVEVDL